MFSKDLHCSQEKKNNKTCLAKSEQISLYNIIPSFNDQRKKVLENIESTGENAGNQHFLLYFRCFLSFQTNFQFMIHIILSPANIFN